MLTLLATILAAQPSRAPLSPRGRGAPDPIIAALTAGDVYVNPDLKGDVDPAALESVAREARPNIIKIVATGTVYPYSSPAEMAARLREALNLGEGVVVVGTPRRIGASSGRLSPARIERALRDANLNQSYARGGLTAALTAAARAVSAGAVRNRQTDAGATGGLLFLLVAGGGGFLGWRAFKKHRELAAARQPVEALRRQALDNLSYVDGYLDLLPAGQDAQQARILRQAAYEKYAQAGPILQSAKTPEQVLRAQPMLQEALAELEQCRVAIDKATGGTGVAMSIPELPSLETDAQKAARLQPVEALRSQEEREAMQRAVREIPENARGVSFFSGRPMPMRDLVPVTIVIQGRKRQVLAARDEAEAIARGETPRIRAFEQEGRCVPWYENRGYDPYRDYYQGSFGSLVDLYVLTQLFGGGLFGGYGDGGYGPELVPADNIGGDPGVAEPLIEHAGGFDFFGQQGDDDTSPDSGGFDSGGDDFGGGDFGGGDFGSDS